jgi:plasmid stabilization system protein ParE
MLLEIRWTEEAEYTFDTILIFIEERWGKSSVEKFKSTLKTSLLNISHHPLMFPESGIENVRKAVITKQTSVFYEVNPDRIVLLFFWDNRQDPLFY